MTTPTVGSTLPLQQLFTPAGTLACPVCACPYTHPRIDPTAARQNLEEANTDPQIRLTFECEYHGHRTQLLLYSHAGIATYTVSYDGQSERQGERPEENWRTA